METINKNWTDADGNHQGGQSCGKYFTIAWQRGPLDESGRNGAFLIEILGSCLEWLRDPEQVVAYGVGYTIIFGSKGVPTQFKLETLKEVLKACVNQVSYYQSQERFACGENQLAIDSLALAIRYLGHPDIESATVHLTNAHDVLVFRRDRRATAGTLGTHQGEAD